VWHSCAVASSRASSCTQRRTQRRNCARASHELALSPSHQSHGPCTIRLAASHPSPPSPSQAYNNTNGGGGDGPVQPHRRWLREVTAAVPPSMGREIAVTYRDSRAAAWPHAGMVGTRGLIAFEMPAREHFVDAGGFLEAGRGGQQVAADGDDSRQAKHYHELHKRGLLYTNSCLLLRKKVAR